MSDKHEKILQGLEKLANTEGYKLVVSTTRDSNGNWLISFSAGNAKVYTRLSSFATVPQIVLDPFCDEMVKQIKGLI
jgi:hypothetical protein